MPEKRDAGCARYPAHGGHACEKADERAVGRRAREPDGEDEDSKDRAVEERAEAIDDLDERAELGSPYRDDAGEQAPDCLLYTSDAADEL